MSEQPKCWWRITVADYGSFEFYGTESEAEEQRRHKARWEQAVARKERIDAPATA